MKRNTIRNVFGYIGLFLLLSVLSCPAIAPAGAAAMTPEKASLNIGLPVPSFVLLPVWVADQKGFFKEEGFTAIKILVFRGDADVIQALAGGAVDVNVSSLNGLLSLIQSGNKAKAVWGGYNTPIFEWYALPRFKSIAETKGARYGVTKFGALTDFLTHHALRNAGLDPEKDVKILQLGGSAARLSAMESSQLEAAILERPATYIAAGKGFVKLVSQKEAVAPDWPTEAIYAKEEFIARNPNTVKAFIRANGKAIEWIKANRDQAAELASKQLKYPLEHCRKAVDETVDGWYADGRLPQKGMKIFWEIAVESGDVKEPWRNPMWLDETFLKTQDQWRR